MSESVSESVSQSVSEFKILTGYVELLVTYHIKNFLHSAYNLLYFSVHFTFCNTLHFAAPAKF